MGGGGGFNWGTWGLRCILQALVYHQKDIWISADIWGIIIAISGSVSGGFTTEQTKDKFNFFSRSHPGLDSDFSENIQGPHLEMNFCQEPSSHNVNIAFNDSISLQFPYQSSYNRAHLFAFPSSGQMGLLI